MDPAEPKNPHDILDMVTFGRRFRSARILAGHDRARDYTAVLASKYGIEISDRSLYAIERGEQMCPVDLLFASLAELDCALGYFFPAVRSDVAEVIGTRARERRRSE